MLTRLFEMLLARFRSLPLLVVTSRLFPGFITSEVPGFRFFSLLADPLLSGVAGLVWPVAALERSRLAFFWYPPFMLEWDGDPIAGPLEVLAGGLDTCFEAGRDMPAEGRDIDPLDAA